MKYSIVFLCMIFFVFLWSCNKESGQIVDNTPNLSGGIRSTTASIYSMDTSFYLGAIEYDEGYQLEYSDSLILLYLQAKDSSKNYSLPFISIVDEYIYLYYTIIEDNNNLISVAEDVVFIGTEVSGIGGGGGDKETHSCDGSCGGSNNLITVCSSCEFVKKNGRITGCKCEHTVFCCHIKTSS